MTGYLIAEEGPISGLLIRFEKDTEWTLGRDIDEVDIVLEDPMVSRKHLICKVSDQGIDLIENLSEANPATLNGKLIVDQVALSEGDIVQIGNTFFRYTLQLPHEEADQLKIDEDSSLESLAIPSLPDTRWLLKVNGGSHSGAEFSLYAGRSYTIGRTMQSCDIAFFNDSAVSGKHATLSLDSSGTIFIEDNNSTNGTFVNNQRITTKTQVALKETVTLGSLTSFVIYDREEEDKTVVSNSQEPSTQQTAVEPPANPTTESSWRDLAVSKRHLVTVALFGSVLLICLFSLISLFQTQPLTRTEPDETKYVEEVLTKYPSVQYSFNPGLNKLFLTGHVLTSVEKQELTYRLQNLKFLKATEDMVVIDEYVWQNTNALLMAHADWQGVTVSSSSPGRFVLKGYLQTAEQAQALSDYVNRNFPYLDKLDNQVVVEGDLTAEIAGQLQEKGFNNILFQLSNGELILSGRVDNKDRASCENLLTELKNIKGIRLIKNFIVYTSESSSLVDLSSNYKVLGFSKKDGEPSNVVINGKILGAGDLLDEMKITEITGNMIVLEKDGLKFKINYNQP
jgi:type III secretion system YscD/HrpQ family protein